MGSDHVLVVATFSLKVRQAKRGEGRHRKVEEYQNKESFATELAKPLSHTLIGTVINH